MSGQAVTRISEHGVNTAAGKLGITARKRYIVAVTCARCGNVANRETFTPTQAPRYCSATCTPKGCPAAVRFDESYIPEPNSGCWLWLKYIGVKGYGFFNYDGKKSYAHQAAYRLFVGVIPEGTEIDHLCRVRCCVNPRHLEAVPPRINTLRGFSASAANARKAACIHGHPFSADNTYLRRQRNGTPARQCRTCGRDRWAASQSRRKEATR